MIISVGTVVYINFHSKYKPIYGVVKSWDDEKYDIEIPNTVPYDGRSYLISSPLEHIAGIVTHLDEVPKNYLLGILDIKNKISIMSILSI